MVDEDDDLGAILARIKEQEESEKFALRLQDEWNQSSGSSDPVPCDESDEALARRLTEEWADQVDDDMDPISGPSKLVERDKSIDDFVEISKPVGAQTRSSRRAQPSRHRSRTYSEGGTPDTKLSEFRGFFTANKECTNCNKAVKSPRGHVRGYSTSLLSLQIVLILE
jgi:baculoviral IAP repeat-containing protein 6